MNSWTSLLGVDAIISSLFLLENDRHRFDADECATIHAAGLISDRCNHLTFLAKEMEQQQLVGHGVIILVGIELWVLEHVLEQPVFTKVTKHWILIVAFAEKTTDDDRLKVMRLHDVAQPDEVNGCHVAMGLVVISLSYPHQHLCVIVCCYIISLDKMTGWVSTFLAGVR